MYQNTYFWRFCGIIFLYIDDKQITFLSTLISRRKKKTKIQNVSNIQIIIQWYSIGRKRVQLNHLPLKLQKHGTDFEKNRTAEANHPNTRTCSYYHPDRQTQSMQLSSRISEHLDLTPNATPFPHPHPFPHSFPLFSGAPTPLRPLLHMHLTTSTYIFL